MFSSYCAPKHTVTGETEGLCPLSEVGRGAAGGMRDGDWGTHGYKSQAGVRGRCFSGGEEEAYLVSDGVMTADKLVVDAGGGGRG